MAEYDTWVDLIILGMVDFDVILGMESLSPYHAVLDCNAKTVTLAIPGVQRVRWKSVSGFYPSKVISFIRAQRLVKMGCLSYLAFIRDTSVEPPPMDSVPMVQEFLDVFLLIFQVFLPIGTSMLLLIWSRALSLFLSLHTVWLQRVERIEGSVAGFIE